MHVARPAADLDRWIADLGTALARAGAPEPRLPGTEYREGTTMLACAIQPDGGIADTRIVASCGNEALDRRAVAKLRRADPLPAGPAAAERRTQMVVMRVAERIRLPFRRAAPTCIYA